MHYIINIPGNVKERGNIVPVKGKPLELKEVLDVFEIPCDEVINPDNLAAFFDKPVTQVGAKKTRSPRD